jgi:cell wall assembly regulator SMI1
MQPTNQHPTTDATNLNQQSIYPNNKSAGKYILQTINHQPAWQPVIESPTNHQICTAMQPASKSIRNKLIKQQTSLPTNTTVMQTNSQKNL